MFEGSRDTCSGSAVQSGCRYSAGQCTTKVAKDRRRVFRGIDRVSFFNFNLLFCHWNLKPSHSWDFWFLVWRKNTAQEFFPETSVADLGPADPCFCIMDPDPAIFIIDLQDANKKRVFKTVFLYITF
jgi:hypothetical protein